MKISIKEKYKDFLLNKIITDNMKNVQQVILEGEIHDKKWVFEISEDLADNLRDICTEQLQVIGFDESYKLTDDGEFLEELIDLLYIS